MARLRNNATTILLVAVVLLLGVLVVGLVPGPFERCHDSFPISGGYEHVCTQRWLP